MTSNANALADALYVWRLRRAFEREASTITLADVYHRDEGGPPAIRSQDCPLPDGRRRRPRRPCQRHSHPQGAAVARPSGWGARRRSPAGALGLLAALLVVLALLPGTLITAPWRWLAVALPTAVLTAAAVAITVELHAIVGDAPADRASAGKAGRALP